MLSRITLPGIGLPSRSTASPSTEMPVAPVPTAMFSRISLPRPPSTEMPSAWLPVASLSRTMLPFEPFSWTPPGLNRTSLPVTSPSLEPLSAMPAPPLRWTRLSTITVPSESPTEMPESLVRKTVLPTIRLRCAPSLTSTPASPASEISLSITTVSVDASRKTPPSLSSSGLFVRPLTRLPSIWLRRESNEYTARPRLPVNVLPSMRLPSEPLNSVTPSPLRLNVLFLTMLPLRPSSASRSSTPATTLFWNTIDSTTPKRAPASRRTP